MCFFLTVLSSCVLPSRETGTVNSKNALPVIIVAFRKWASLPLPVPGGGGGGGVEEGWGDTQVQSLYSGNTDCVTRLQRLRRQRVLIEFPKTSQRQ